MVGPRGAVLFDVDGTLVDSNYLHALAWVRALRDHGHRVAAARVHRLIGMGSDKLCAELIGEADERAIASHAEHFARLKGDLVAFPRAGDLLREVRRRGARVVLATSAEEQDLEDLLDAVGASDAIDHVVSSKDVDEAKPAGDIFALALAAAGVPAERAVVVGDTVWDVEAARRCGLACVCVTTGGVSRAELERAGAAEVYDDVAELLERLDASRLAAFLAPNRQESAAMG